MTNKILLSHGSGGKLTHELIKNIFAKYFQNEYLAPLSDSALIDLPSNKIAFTTDSYVIHPLRFAGGDIGKLAICGTVNDLVVSGAEPKYISCGFIIEEGLEIELLEEIVASMAATAVEAGVQIVTGDTKVVESGSADKLFINTAGIGLISRTGLRLGLENVEVGDKIIINGNIGDHGMAIMAAREGLAITSDIKSDCAPLNLLIRDTTNIKFMRDPTRGGVATTLCEIADSSGFDIEIDESALPISESVRGIAEVLGIDPLYSANEGKVIIICAAQHADELVSELKKHPLGKDSAIIGAVVCHPERSEGSPGHLSMKTTLGTSRRLTMLTGSQLPRIC